MMASFSHNALNLVHRFNPNNTATFSSCGFHFRSPREQDVILRHRISPVLFCLAAQNNPVVIDLRYSFGSTLESNHNIGIKIIMIITRKSHIFKHKKSA